MQIDSAAQSTWGSPIASGSLDAAGTEVLSLGGYAELLVEIDDVTYSTAVQACIELTPDGGQTWRQTGYKNGAAVTDSLVIATSSSADGWLWLTNFNRADRKTKGKGASSIVGTNVTARMGKYDTAEAHNGLKIVPKTSGTFSGGTYTIYGRR
jgi:hypothetical protein